MTVEEARKKRIEINEEIQLLSNSGIVAPDESISEKERIVVEMIRNLEYLRDLIGCAETRMVKL